MEKLLSVQNLSKKFCKSLKRSMVYAATDSLGAICGIKPKTEELRVSEFWSLNDVSFDLYRGEKLGVIGTNGSGKSTLLRVLSGILPPDKGRVCVNGRVGALIAVGAGFHPHMTGRENIFLNGIILGMRKFEIRKKLDEIISFSEIGSFIDSPVSTYSSGMRVRLGFSIAVHIKPDILILDEVLSVGDESFKFKSMQKLKELTESCGTIFVSHSMRQVCRVCDKVLWLENGVIRDFGLPGKVVNNYLTNTSKMPSGFDEVKVLGKAAFISTLSVETPKVLERRSELELEISCESGQDIEEVVLVTSLFNKMGELVCITNSQKQKMMIARGEHRLKLKTEPIRLTVGAYYGIVKAKTEMGALVFEVQTPAFEVVNTGDKLLPSAGYFEIEANWSSCEKN